MGIEGPVRDRVPALGHNVHDTPRDPRVWQTVLVLVRLEVLASASALAEYLSDHNL